MSSKVTTAINTDIEKVEIKVVDKNLYKNKLIKYIRSIEFELTKERWEAMMLVMKCQEYQIRYEKILGKRTKDMTEVEKNYIKEKFFQEEISKMDDEKADKLVNHINKMFDILG